MVADINDSGGEEIAKLASGSNSKEEVESGLARFEPYPLVGQPECIANAALFLASDTSAFITGHTLIFDGSEQAGS